MLDLEMWSVASALRENSKLSNPVWIVCFLTAKLTTKLTMNFFLEKNTQWLMPQASYRTGSALIIRRFLKYFVEPIRVVYAIRAWWTNIKAMTQSLLQQNGHTNRSVLGATCVSNISMRALIRTNCECNTITTRILSHQSGRFCNDFAH